MRTRVVRGMRSGLYGVFLALSVGVLGVACLPVLLLPRRAVMRVVRFWAKLALSALRVIVGIDSELRGFERLPDTPVIIAAKHQSAWETIVFLAVLPLPAYVLKRELLSLPVYGWYTRRLGMIAIDRKGGAASLRRMMAATRQAVADGRPIVIFPEGTRTPPGTSRPLHSGVAALYAALDLPVVPVALNSGLFWRRGFWDKRAGRILCEIQPALPPGLERAELMQRLASAIGDGSRLLEREARAAGDGEPEPSASP